MNRKSRRPISPVLIWISGELSAQGFRIGHNIEIFMPICEGSLHDIIPREKLKGRDAARDLAERMLVQMLDALHFVHTREPPVTHRDIKPANILYQGTRFLLTDFGIAKVVDTSRTMIGTPWYAALEVVRRNAEQTPKSRHLLTQRNCRRVSR